MVATFIICLLFSKSLAQMDGQFWWLNSKLDKFREPPPQPKFEDLSDFETDQSAKIVFRDDGLLHREENPEDLKVGRKKNFDKIGKSNQAIKFEDKSELSWPDYTKEAIAVKPNSMEDKQNNNGSNLPNSDIFELKFPDDNFISRDKDTNNTYKINPPITVKSNGSKEFNATGKITYLTNLVIPYKVHKNISTNAEPICTYMKKSECNRIRGVIYVRHQSEWKQGAFDTRLVCCILPMRPELQSSKIYFVDDSKPCKRCKRSEGNSALKQRNALLLRKFGPQTHKLKLTTANPTKISHKVVTPSDEYVDPYWNIKNSNFKNPTKTGSQHTTKYEYDEDYVEDYVVEIPKPGLTGIYSDHGPAKPGWFFPTTRPSYGEIDSDEDDEPSFGYSPTVDPRTEDRRSTPIPRVSLRPVKLSTYIDERNYDAESQTISYQSNPDFQVLQGFKLLNLFRNKSRIQRNGKKSTTESFYENGSKEDVLTASLESSSYGEKEGVMENSQLYKDCGRIAKGSRQNFDNGKEMGDTEKGSHPSLALVVLTKRQQSLLCYATLVHPKAAVTAADCVFGRTDPGEITVIVGAWRLTEESHEEWQKRMATIHIHSQYKPGNLAHNLALLHWKRPLRLNANIQPACLTEPHVGDSCKFFGWGGYDQAIRKQARWQRAIVLAPSTCEERVTSKRMPKEAFCVSVQSRRSVTGTGGPLLCTVGGRQSAAGVAVWRDLAVVLLPPRDWVVNTIEDLQLDS